MNLIDRKRSDVKRADLRKAGEKKVFVKNSVKRNMRGGIVSNGLEPRHLPSSVGSSRDAEQ